MAAVAGRRNLLSLGQRLRTSNCLFSPTPSRVIDAKSGPSLGNATKIYGRPPKPPAPDGLRLRDRDPHPNPSVSETKFMPSLYRAIGGFQHLIADMISPKLDIFISYPDEDNSEYFAAHSTEDGIISTAKYYMYPPFRDFFFTGNTCNGLLLLQNVEWENLVWNPTTNEFKIFPKTLVIPPGVQCTYHDSGMWCDPSYGYKVMQVVMTHELEDGEECYNNPSYHIELYSYRSNLWKIIQCEGFANIGHSGVCIDGAYYGRARVKGVKQRDILCFDFSTETLSTIPFPTITRGSFCSYPLAYQGLLSYIICWPTDDINTLKHEFWVMNKDGSWTRESVFQACGVGTPLCFSQNGQFLYFKTPKYELVVFDRAAGKLKHLGIYFYWQSVKELIPVVENFVPLDRMLNVEGWEEKKKTDEADLTEALDGPA